MDYVEEYIRLKKELKTIKEKLLSLELFILDEHRDDERIHITAPRKTITIKESTYDRLKTLGLETEVTVKRKKKIDEFDVDVREVIESNPENIEVKLSKESIRVK
jgi:hypothetical protein